MRYGVLHETTNIVWIKLFDVIMIILSNTSHVYDFKKNIIFLCALDKVIVGGIQLMTKLLK